jgi:hypothetical protein
MLGERTKYKQTIWDEGEKENSIGTTYPRVKISLDITNGLHG